MLPWAKQEIDKKIKRNWLGFCRALARVADPKVQTPRLYNLI